MIYIYIFVPLIFIGLFVWNTIRSSKHLKKVKEFSENSDISRVVLWIDLDMINGQKTDYTYSYWKNVKSKISNKNTDVIVLLLKEGEYNFIASSRSNSKFKNVPIGVSLKAGVTYQLGCDENGIYCIEDLDPERYNL